MLTAVWKANNAQAWLMSVDRAVERSEQRSSHEGRGLVIGPWRVDSNSSALNSDCTTRDSSHHLLDHRFGHLRIWKSCLSGPTYHAECGPWNYHKSCEPSRDAGVERTGSRRALATNVGLLRVDMGVILVLTNAVVLEGTR